MKSNKYSYRNILSWIHSKGGFVSVSGNVLFLQENSAQPAPGSALALQQSHSPLSPCFQGLSRHRLNPKALWSNTIIKPKYPNFAINAILYGQLRKCKQSLWIWASSLAKVSSVRAQNKISFLLKFHWQLCHAFLCPIQHRRVTWL